MPKFIGCRKNGEDCGGGAAQERHGESRAGGISRQSVQRTLGRTTPRVTFSEGTDKTGVAMEAIFKINFDRSGKVSVVPRHLEIWKRPS